LCSVPNRTNLGKWGNCLLCLQSWLFAPQAASTECSGCPPGSFSLAGAAACTECKAGLFSLDKGASGCGGCPGNTFSSQGATSCLACLKTYYFEATTTSCLACPKNTICETDGGSTLQNLQVDKDYWRASPDAVTKLKCPLDNACGDGTDYYDYCLPGSNGVLCGVCSEGWYLDRAQNRCAVCSSNDFSAALVQLLVIVVVVSTAFVCVFRWNRNNILLTQGESSDKKVQRVTHLKIF